MNEEPQHQLAPPPPPPLSQPRVDGTMERRSEAGEMTASVQTPRTPERRPSVNLSNSWRMMPQSTSATTPPPIHFGPRTPPQTHGGDDDPAAKERERRRQSIQMAEDAEKREVLIQQLALERGRTAKLTGELALKETLTHGLLEQLERERKRSVKLSGDLAARTGELQALRDEVEMKDRIEARMADAGVIKFSPVASVRKSPRQNDDREQEARVVRDLVCQLEELRVKLEAAEARALSAEGDGGERRPRAEDEEEREGSANGRLSSQEYEEIIMKMRDEKDELEEQLEEQRTLWSDMNSILSNENEELKRALALSRSAKKKVESTPSSPMGRFSFAASLAGGRLGFVTGDKGDGGGPT